MVSSIHKRSPAIISCTAVLRSTIPDDVLINITWSKNNNQLYNNNKISIISVNLTKYTYQSNLTIHILEDSDEGLYSCSATTVLLQSSNQLGSSATSSIYLDVEGTITFNNVHINGNSSLCTLYPWRLYFTSDTAYTYYS